MPLGRPLTADEIARLKILQTILYRDILKPVLPVFQAFGNATKSLACVILDNPAANRCRATDRRMNRLLRVPLDRLHQ